MQLNRNTYVFDLLRSFPNQNFAVPKIFYTDWVRDSDSEWFRGTILIRGADQALTFCRPHREQLIACTLLAQPTQDQVHNISVVLNLSGKALASISSNLRREHLLASIVIAPFRLTYARWWILDNYCSMPCVRKSISQNSALFYLL